MGISRKQYSGQRCYTGQKRRLHRSDKKNEMRMQRQDKERIHPRDNGSGAGLPKITKLQACDEKRRRTHTEENC